MKDIDLTDLVCRARRQLISPRERRELWALLAGSDELRFTSALLRGLDYESGVKRGDDALIARIVARVGDPRNPRWRGVLRWSMGAAILLGSVGAAAAWQIRGMPATQRMLAPTVDRAGHLATNGGAASKRADNDSAVTSTVNVRGVPAPVSSNAPVTDKGSASRAIPTAKEHGTPTEPSTSGAARDFAEANRARREGRVEQAIQRYRGLLAKYPQASEAGPARLALAKLLANRLPEEALEEYRRLAQGSGQLRPEALWGTLEVARRLGRHDLERAARDELLSSYPDSPYAAHELHDR